MVETVAKHGKTIDEVYREAVEDQKAHYELIRHEVIKQTAIFERIAAALEKGSGG